MENNNFNRRGQRQARRGYWAGRHDGRQGPFLNALQIQNRILENRRIRQEDLFRRNDQRINQLIDQQREIIAQNRLQNQRNNLAQVNQQLVQEISDESQVEQHEEQQNDAIIENQQQNFIINDEIFQQMNDARIQDIQNDIRIVEQEENNQRRNFDESSEESSESRSRSRSVQRNVENQDQYEERTIVIEIKVRIKK